MRNSRELDHGYIIGYWPLADIIVRPLGGIFYGRAMIAWWVVYILGPFYAFLPKRWRVGIQISEQYLARAAVLSGILELVVTLAIARVWALFFFSILADQYLQYLKTSYSSSVYSVETVSHAGTVVFLYHPFTWVLIYFCAEALFRIFAAVSTGEAWGSLPLYAVEYAVRRAFRRPPPPELPLVRDEVTPGGSADELRIASCRQKGEWKYPFTIRYGGTYFQVVAEQFNNAGPRPYVYSLRRLALGTATGGLRSYDPDDILTPVQRVESLA